MSDIVKFPNKDEFQEPPRVIWTCICGCATFYLLSEGDAECAICGLLVTDPAALGWRSAEPPPVPLDPPMEKVVRTIVDFNDPAANLRSCLKHATPQEAEVVIVIASDGNGGHDIHTYRGDGMGEPEQQEWLDGMLLRARNMVIGNRDRGNGDEGGQ